MQCRLGILSDLPAIREIAYASFSPYIPIIGLAPAPMNAPLDAQISAGQILVVEDKRTLIGYVVFYAEGGDMHLEAVAILPTFRGQGLGKLLINEVEAAARTAGLNAVNLYTNAAMTANLKLYPHLGYSETDRRQENGFDRVYYRKKLRID